MSTDGSGEVTAMLLTELSAALVGNLKLALDRASPSDGSQTIPPTVIVVFYTEALEQDIELLRTCSDRFESEGRLGLQG